ncbi:MAG: hypothetical protein AAFN07_12705 [Pseudomonadota bacterium]
MNKAVYVKAHFKPLMKMQSVKVPTGEVKKGLFGGKKEVTRKEEQLVATDEFSDCSIDGERLTADINQAIATLNGEGYEVVSITPVTSGSYQYRYNTEKWVSQSGGWGWGYGYGYGFSMTEGVTILARKVG